MKTFTAAFCAALVASQVEVPVHRWEPQDSGVTARLRGVSAVNASVAWASGANGTVLRTSDTTGRWEKLTVPDAATLDFRDVDAINALTAYVLSIGNGAASRVIQWRSPERHPPTRCLEGGPAWNRS